jgi:phosphatidylserine/phosphatidylglycerophosphate/cardiolipin synthase-like enzyme
MNRPVTDAVLPGHRYRFPWREGNRAALLIDGPQFLPAMYAAVARARRYILLELYLFESGNVADRFIEAFADAARRGVEVNLLLDDFGARALRRADRERLLRAGVTLVLYNPLRYGRLFANLARDHRKLLLVDGEVAFVGGAGLTDEFDPPAQPERRWRETIVRIEGPVLADWQRLFADVWNRQDAKTLALPDPPPSTLADGMRGRVTVARGPGSQEIQRDAIKRIRAAGRRVWIMTAYFVPSWRFKRALKHAAARGVDVRLLLPGPISDHPGVRHAGRRFYARLLAAGVRIFEYQPRFLHAKAILCDDWASIGSSNLDRWALRWNLEANQEIEDPRFAAQVQAMFTADFREAIECQYAHWLSRPWLARARERFWGRVDLFLHRLGRGRVNRD